MKETLHQLFAVASPGVESILRAELAGLGAGSPVIVEGGVTFQGDDELLMRANLWSRTASRILLRIAEFPAANLRALASGAGRVDWKEYLGPQHRILVKATCHKSRVYHSGAAAQRVQVAACEVAGCVRAEVQETSGDGAGMAEATVYVRLERDVCMISLDTSGEHLHMRSYRLETAKAPLRENLAAAVLLRASWDGTCALLDPMCGSGTFPIEAALLAARMPPGGLRRFAFMDWACFDEARWMRVQDQARQQQRPVSVPILGADRDPGAVAIARRNAQRAGVLPWIDFEQRPLARTPDLPGPGLLVCNPPYGARIGNPRDLRDLYAALGNVVRRLPGWRAAILTTDRHLASATGLTFTDDGVPLAHGGLRVGIFITR
ncbi:MAG: RNA methyltransferase [Deltaproteobacteria bacterium HGW-Deltaproteobacteria-22]|jgi:putative N6-adenine-specific DNA methylase|nr:MAG: RNA methyltransferase [Deltaproteobacteria bacterium HGW-Deltaproteobacteria-22]